MGKWWGLELNYLVLVHRFGIIFMHCFNAILCKDNEYQWYQVNDDLADFQTPMYDHETSVVHIQKRMGACLQMML